MKKLKDKKILAVLGYEGYFGGERANLQVLKLLRNAGADVRCLVLNDGGNDFRDALQLEGFKIYPTRFGPSLFGLSGNPIHYLKNLVGMFFVSIKIISLVKQFRPTHIYVPNYIQFLYALLSLYFIESIVVFRIGDPPENSRLHKFLWKKIISPRVNYFVANSSYTLKCLFNTGVDVTKGQVINNCLTRCVTDNKIIKGNMHETVVVYAGQINAQKGVDIAVRAAIILCNKYDNVRFNFIGPFDCNSQYVKSIFELVEKQKLNSRINFLGFQNDVLRYFKSSDLHICPSIQEESSANVVIEAKSCGIPSIVFARGGLPELIKHKHDGYICKTADVQGLVEGLDFFLSDQTRRKNASIKAKMSFSRFSEEIARNKWVSLFA